MSNLKIKIDNFEFNLISKSVPSIDVNYKKVEITSINIKTEESTHFFAYISQSGALWRLCSGPKLKSIEKYDNYIQATILDMRLQSFIFLNYDSLPDYSEKEITCIISKDTFHNEYMPHINNRGIDFGKTVPYIINESVQKKIFDEYIKTIPNNIDTSSYTSANFLKKFNMTEIDIYKSKVDSVISDIIQGNEHKYEQYKKGNNKYEDVPVTSRYYDIPVTTKLSFTISFYFNKNWYNNDYGFALQYYLKSEYDIIDEHGRLIELGYNIIPETFIMNYKMNLNFYKYNNQYYGIRLKHKYNNNIIIVHIGKIWLKTEIPSEMSTNIHSSKFNGYHICNIIDEDVKITKFGLYKTYYTEPEYNNDDSGSNKFNYDYKYITKPLEYKNQIDYNYCSGGKIIASEYNFMCNCNVEKYLIKELIEQDNRLKNNEHMFANKYLKYKQKYLNLKNYFH